MAYTVRMFKKFTP